MRWLPLLSLIIASTVTAAPKQRLVIPIVEATSPADHPPRSIFGRDGWRPEQLGRVVLHLVPQASFVFGGMELDNCGSAELEYWFLAGGKHLTPSVALQPVETDDLVVVLTGIADLCLSNGRILDGKRSAYELEFTETVPGTVSASSTLSPELSNHAMRLFDDDLERPWSSDGEAKNERLHFGFEEETTIDALLIWNGHQRSEKSFRANARVKVLTLASEGQADIRLDVADTMGGQTVKLPTPWQGKHFSLSATEVTRGTRANNLMVSELRLVSGERILSLESRSFDEQVAQELRTAFQTAKLHGILDHGLRSKKLTLFLWSDGSMVGATRTHLVHGSMTVKKSDASKLVLTVTGTVRDQRVPGGKSEPFNGQLTLKAAGAGNVRVAKSSSKRIPKVTLEPVASD